MSASEGYLNAITRLGEAKAQAQAEAARQNGQIWGNTISNIGQMVAQYPEQQAKLKEIANRADLTNLERQREERAAATEQRQVSAQQQASQVLGQIQKTPDGLWDTNDLMQKLTPTGLDPQHIESLTTGFEKMNDITLAQRKRQEEGNADLAHGLLGIYSKDEPITSDSLSFNAEALKGIGGLNDADAQAIHDMGAKVPPGTDLRPLLKSIEQKKKEYQPVYKTAAPGSTIYEERTGEPTAQVPNPVADERARHDKALEDISSLTAGRAEANAAETARHNKAMEGIDQQRANQANKVAGAQAADITKLTPSGLDMAALNYKKTGVMPPLGMGDRTTRQQILNRAAELKPEDIARIESGGLDVAANKAGYRADSGSLVKLQQQRDAIGAFENTAQKNIDQFLAVAKKVPDTGIPLLNMPVRWMAGAGGSEDMAKYNAARQVAVSEIARIVQNPNLSGTLSDSARKEIEAFNPSSATLGQTIAVMNLLKQDMQNRKTSLDEQLGITKGRISGSNASETAPSTGGSSLPSIGSTFQGGKVLKVTPVP